MILALLLSQIILLVALLVVLQELKVFSERIGHYYYMTLSKFNDVLHKPKRKYTKSGKYAKKATNQSSTSNGKRKMSGWTKRKISNSHKARWERMTPEQRQAVIDNMLRKRAAK